MKLVVGFAALVAAIGFSVPASAHGPGHGGAGCNPIEVSRAAHALDEAAAHFAQLIQTKLGWSHVTGDAHKLAREADHLHRSAHRGASCEHLRQDFHGVEEAFHYLERGLRRAYEVRHDAHVMYDFRQVESAYRAVSQALFGGGFQPPVVPPYPPVRPPYPPVQPPYPPVRPPYPPVLPPVRPPYPPALVTTNVICQSDEYRREICPVGGRIVAAQVAAQLSRRACRQGQNWGFTDSAIWVSNGCRANFQVTLQRGF